MSGVIYAKSPIREAVFDVKFKFEETPELTVFEDAFKAIETEYSKREVTNSQFLSLEMKIGEEPKVNSGGGPNGLRLTSQDGRRVVQFRTDGFTFSKLEPYSEWSIFSAEAKKLLSVYVDKVQPLYAERIALRYINAIKIPEISFQIEDYFLTAPRIAETLPQGLVQFFFRSVIQDDQSEGTFAVINQTIENSREPQIDEAVVIFDIDVFQPNLRVIPNSVDFWTRVDSLKQLRTRIFEGSLTDKTKDLFN